MKPLLQAEAESAATAFIHRLDTLLDTQESREDFLCLVAHLRGATHYELGTAFRRARDAGHASDRPATHWQIRHRIDELMHEMWRLAA